MLSEVAAVEEGGWDEPPPGARSIQVQSSWRAAAVRHEDTPYDECRLAGASRPQAPEVERILERWRTPPPAVS